MALYQRILEYKLPYTEEESKDWSFNQLTKSLMNRDMNKDFTLLFQHLQINIKPRIALSSFMTAWFPDIVMENIEETDQTKKSLIAMSKIILRELHKTLVEQQKSSYFDNCIKMYNDLFQVWMKKDKEVLKEELVNKFKEFQITHALLNTPKFNEVKHQDYAVKWKKDIESVKGKIVKQLEKLGDCEEEIKKCRDMEQYDELKTIDVDKIISETAHEMYWTKLSKELSEKPPNWTTTVKIIQEIRDRFIIIQPKMESSYSALIDMKHIEHLRTNNVLHNKNALQQIFNNIITCFMETQSSSADEDLLNWTQEIGERFNSPDIILYEFIPMLLNKILIRLDKLEEQINKIRSSLRLLKEKTKTSSTSNSSKVI